MRENLWTSYNDEDIKNLNELSEGYRKFISKCKTERLCVNDAIEKAEHKGFVHLKKFIDEGRPLPAGTRFYLPFMDKTIILGIIGKNSISQGMNILGAHIDSPRLDLKQKPLYESNGLAYFDTHYYGGIKKYQWVTLPLALYGVIVKKDGTVIDVSVGDNEGDPVFSVTDLLIHLSSKQLEKTAAKVIEGEQLDLLIGSIPKDDKDDESGKDSKDEKAKKDEKKEKIREKVKANILSILFEKYGIDEEDFLSAEIEVVPAGEAKDMGFDRSMIIGYGQDDRICAYTSLKAILDIDETPERTSLCVLVDKEEIGSVGATGMESKFFENTVAELLNLNESPYSDIKLRRALTNSFMLSSDVSAALDPTFEEVFERKNSAYFGYGIVFNKYTGARGKAMSNDANPEYMAKLRRILDDANIGFQTCELGKVDAGGGGTIAYILGNYAMNVIDSGVALLCMHSPWEISNKADIYEAYKCYSVFLKNMK